MHIKTFIVSALLFFILMACDSKEKPTGAQKNNNISETQNIEQKNKKAREIESAIQIDNNISACKLTPLQWMLIKDFALQHEIDRYRRGQTFLFDPHGSDEKSAVAAIMAEIESVDGRGGNMTFLPHNMIGFAFFYEQGLKSDTKCGVDKQACKSEIEEVMLMPNDKLTEFVKKSGLKMTECGFVHEVVQK